MARFLFTMVPADDLGLPTAHGAHRASARRSGPRRRGFQSCPGARKTDRGCGPKKSLDAIASAPALGVDLAQLSSA